MKKIITLAFLSCLMVTFSNAQERSCAAMDVLAQQLENNPKMELQMQQIERFTQQKISEFQQNREINGTIISIPVVVHIIYNNATTNISVAQIQSQIDVLNEDFRRTNSDADGTWSQAADTEIEFCLAVVDPLGNPTNGITRRETTQQDWLASTNNMKKTAQGGIDPWDTTQYLNMWTVPRIIRDNGQTILGYAQFPGGPASTDGVVMGYNYFGRVGNVSAPFDLGRTTTHEVGHFLNLRHIWGDGGCGVDDFVADTPESDASNFGCATTHVSCGSLDMVQNYMDYSDDACMNLFTQGQTDRMRAVLVPGGIRAALGASTKCTGGVPPTCDDGVQNGDETGVDCGGSTCEPCEVTCYDGDINLSITFDNYPEETGWTLTNSSGALIASAAYTNAEPDGSTVNETFSGLADDTYTFTITDSYGDGICCAFGNGSYTLTGPGGEVIVTGGIFASEESTDFCMSSEVVPTCDDGIQNGNETGVDCGGSECEPCTTIGDVILHEGFFETGWDNWVNIGDDAALYSGRRSYEGDWSVRLRDNTNRSTMTLKNVRLNEPYETIYIDFYFKAIGMDAGEMFQVEYYDGNVWAPVAIFTEGVDYDNKIFYNATVTLSNADYIFPERPRFKFRTLGNGRNDHVYIDQVTISADLSGARESGQISRSMGSPDAEDELFDFVLYPNPTRGVLTVRMMNTTENASYRMLNMLGQTVQTGKLESETSLEVSQLQSGVYFIEVKNGAEILMQRFVKE